MDRYTHIVVGLVVTYWILAVAIVFGLVFVPPQPLVDRIEAADPTPVSRDVINFFEHTPRVEAVLQLEQDVGDPDDQRARDRVRYGTGHLLLLAVMIADLALIAIVTLIGARRGVFDKKEGDKRRALAGRTATGVRGTIVFLAVVALAILALMYSGFWIHTRYGHPTDNSFVFILPLHLVLTVLVITAIGTRPRKQMTPSGVNPNRDRSRG